jgi:hypothetical protein
VTNDPNDHLGLGEGLFLLFVLWLIGQEVDGEFLRQGRCCLLENRQQQ